MNSILKSARLFACFLIAALVMPHAWAGDEDPDPPEVQIGERLFLETRFAQFFAVRCNGDVNVALPAGDPVVAQIVKADGIKMRRADPSTQLERCVASFKTPGLRDLPNSPPFLHTGRMESIADVLRFYQRFSILAREGKVRNADPDILKISISDADIEALNAFLLSLTEDYE